ncbi:MAG: ABC transporter permease [Bacillota bacterium]|nr:ABC transporter permease [Bacillota bacterium]
MPVNTGSLKAQRQPRESLGVWLGRYYLIISLVLLVLISSILSPRFLSQENLMNIAIQNSAVAIVSFGMLYVILTGGIDLSVGSVVALAACFTAGFLEAGWSIPLTILAVLALMLIPGAISGGLVAIGKMEPFIASLAMMTIVRGAAYMYQVGSVRVIFNNAFINGFTGNLGPIPVPVLIMALAAVVLHVVLKYTTFGRKLYAIGGNRDAARLVGISLRKNLFAVYMLSSVLSGLVGILMAARLRVGTALVGQGMELDAIAAVVIGGASFAGGRGTILNTLIGAFIIGIIGNMMNLMGIAAYPQMVIKGVIIILAVLARRG